MAISKIQAKGVIHDIKAKSIDTPALIDGVGFDGTSSISHYAVCSTAAATAAKTAYINGFSLVSGAKVSIQFTYGNEASSPTLNVNSTGAIAIMTDGSQAADAGAWKDGALLDLVYNGTNWMIAGGSSFDAIRDMIDPTLTKSEMIADAKVTGDRINAAFPQESVESAEVAAFSDGADGIPLASALITLPYDANGYTGLTLYHFGKNLFDNANANYVTNAWIGTDGSIQSNNNYKYSPQYVPIAPGEWTFSFQKDSTSSLPASIALYDADKTFERFVGIGSTTAKGRIHFNFTVNHNEAYVRVARLPKYNAGSVQFERGITPTAFEAYKADTHVFDWTSVSGTIYGGTLDPINGVLTSSYASDGSALSPAVTYALDPVQINTFKGNNTIFANAGKVAVTYRQDNGDEDRRIESYVLAAFPQESVASGDVITFPDGADGLPMVSLLDDIPVTQEGSGTPAPDNVRPLVGYTELTATRAGKNLFNESAASWVDNYTLSGTDDSLVSNTSGKYSPTYYPIRPGVWTLQLNKGASSNIAARLNFYNAAKTLVGTDVTIAATTSQGLKTGTFTVPAGAVFFRVAGVAKTNTTNIQIEAGSSATAYEAYKGINTYHVNWTDEAGIIYGGTLDVVTGEMKPFAHLRLGDLSWSYNSGGLFYFASVTDDYRATGATTDVFCPIYAGGDVNSTDTTPDKIICFSSGSQIRIRDKAYSDGTTFYNAIKNYYVVYQKRPASQETVMIDPVQVTSLLGYNTIWADKGTVAATYRADPKMYVDNAIAAAIANL